MTRRDITTHNILEKYIYKNSSTEHWVITNTNTKKLESWTKDFELIVRFHEPSYPLEMGSCPCCGGNVNQYTFLFFMSSARYSKLEFSDDCRVNLFVPYYTTQKCNNCNIIFLDNLLSTSFTDVASTLISALVGVTNEVVKSGFTYLHFDDKLCSNCQSRSYHYSCPNCGKRFCFYCFDNLEGPKGLRGLFSDKKICNKCGFKMSMSKFLHSVFL